MTLTSSVHVRRRRARAAAAGLVALAAVAAGVTTGAAPSGAATKTVCAAGCDYTSIAAATAAAVNGDVITVAAGTYYEPRILISQKGITLRGAGSGQTIIDGQSRTDHVGGDGQIRVESAVAAAGPITVEGLTLRNTPATAPGRIRYAVQVKASRPDPSAIVFDDVAIEGIGAADYGMYVAGTAGVAEAPFTFENGSITGTAYHAILFENWRRAVTVEDSTFTEPTTGSATLIGFNSDARAERTTEPYTFRRNTFTGNAIRFYGYDASNQGFDTMIAEDNVITGLDGTDVGISFVNSGTGSASAPTNVTITGNRISGPGANARGIFLSGSTGQPVGPATVTGNSISGVGRSIDLFGTGLGVVDIYLNRLVGPGTSVSNNASSGTVGASGNWYGCNVGPLEGGCNRVVGTGTTVVDSWLVATPGISSPTVGSKGTATVTAELRQFNTGGQVGSLPAVFDGLETSYAAAKGSVAPATGVLAGGVGPNGTYTAPTGPTTDTVTATVDGYAIDLPVEVTGSGIRGRLTSTETGAPISGLQVRLYKDGSTGSAATTTAADGTYSFGNLTTGTYRLWFRDVAGTQWVSEYYDESANLASSTPIAFTTGDVLVADEALTPKPPVIPVTFRTIEGTVSDPEGDPIPGIQVRLYAAPFTGGSAATTTDAEGHYEFNRRTAGDYKLWFRDVRGTTWVSTYDGDASTLEESDGVTLTDQANLTVDATLQPRTTDPGGATTGAITGRVIDELGFQPIAGVQVRLYPVGGTGSSATTTAADGTFSFTGKPVGNYQIWVRDLSGQWVSEYYDNATSLATAGWINVAPGGTNDVGTILLAPRTSGA